MAQQRHRKRRRTTGTRGRTRKPKGTSKKKKITRRVRAIAPKPPAPRLPSDVEPTPGQLTAERARIEEQNRKLRANRQVPAAGKDLLASYMEQLSHIPLSSTPAGTWVVQSFSLVYELSKLAEPQTIDRVLVGGSGWSFEGSADNLMICGATPVEDTSWTAIKSMFR